MHFQSLKYTLLAGTILTGFVACNNSVPKAVTEIKQSLDSLHFTVEEAPEWSSLFNRKSGWFGGDGIFAVSMDGKETPEASKKSEVLFWFSDTMLGEITGDSLHPGYEMINNSLALMKPGTIDSSNIRFSWKKENGKNVSVFVPKTPATEKGDYYWLGDGWINHEKNNDLYIFGYRVRNVSQAAAFGFKEFGNTLIVVPSGSQPPFTTYRDIDIPFFLGKDIDSTGTFGAGVYVNTAEAGAKNPDGYVYIYGIRGKNKGLMVARVKPADIETFTQWTFWDGNAWSSDVAKIAIVTDRLSNELGMMQLSDGRYALTFQGDGLGKNVSIRIGETPYGPFGRLIPVYDCSRDVAEDKDFFPYNAKVHPVLSSPDELLISYNVNSFDFFNDIKHHPNLYRPRFVKVKILP